MLDVFIRGTVRRGCIQLRLLHAGSQFREDRVDSRTGALQVVLIIKVGYQQVAGTDRAALLTTIAKRSAWRAYSSVPASTSRC